MSTLAAPAPADEEIPDDLFATLPIPHRVGSADPDDVLATLPDLPSVDGLDACLRNVQVALDAAREEAAALRKELREKADALRAMAAALEAI